MLDLGVLHLPRESGVRVQFTINRATRSAIGALVQMVGSSVTLTVLAAPKSDTLWPDMRDELVESITSGGGTASFREGPFGPEVEALIPKPEVNETRHVRLVGVDGPRWMLRAEIVGQAVMDSEAREAVYDYLRRVVVDRGSDPHPVRDVIELTMPESAQIRVDEKLGRPVVRRPNGPELPELR
ncbi:DUF3710 domain-containing protein [Flaviflexus salsibiostraticola]|uniref:DUF3710 domain-containing protein n=2 Tax=Flaviflexus salsibiostraticola TaxID=1282737 RepID=A0A3Q8WS93_9ACTO|nr:DUF3710 domain-containing protein [Flaviflexus salsibiostraticola]